MAGLSALPSDSRRGTRIHLIPNLNLRRSFALCDFGTLLPQRCSRRFWKMRNCAFLLCRRCSFLDVAASCRLLLCTCHSSSLVAFKELYRSLVLLRFFKRGERTQVATPSSFGIFLSRIQAVFAGFQFANHVSQTSFNVLTQSDDAPTPECRPSHDCSLLNARVPRTLILCFSAARCAQAMSQLLLRL